MTHRRKLLIILIASAVLSCLAAAGAMYLSTGRYEQAGRDAQLHQNRPSHTITIQQAGLFLKANSSLVGPGEGIALRHLDRRNDHEVELAVVMGKDGIAGYAIALDITIRGTEDRSFRKSPDSYTVLGPWLVTADEIADPHKLGITLSVNGTVKQKFNTDDMAHKIPRCIEWVSAIHTLEPGDILATGTNHRGLNAFHDGDVVELTTEGLGHLRINVSDPLKRTWSRETRLERQDKGLDPLAPQLSGKYAPQA